MRCAEGDVACTGSVQIKSYRPISTGRRNARQIVTVAAGAYGEIPAGKSRVVTLKLQPEATARTRHYRSTRVLWQTFSPDGAQQYIFVRHLVKLLSTP